MSIFAKLEKLGCKDPMDINYAFPWIQGRLSAYGITTSPDDDPEDLVDYIMATSGTSPHKDTSLIKRPKVDTSKIENKMDISKDENWLNRINFLCNKFIDVDFQINFKKKGFRVHVDSKHDRSTLFNIDAIRQLSNGEIRCTATLTQINQDNLKPIDFDSAPKEHKVKPNKPVSFTSINLILFLDWYRKQALKVSHDIVQENIKLVDSKYKNRK